MSKMTKRSLTKRSKISPEAPPFPDWLWADLNELKAKNPEALEARIAAMRAARERERQRLAAKDRKHREERKAQAIRKRELSKLIGALGMLGLDPAGERAAAALQVERLRAKLIK